MGSWGLVLLFIVMTIVIPMAQMLFGKGPNNWRRLLRLDLAALLVIVAGFAGALAIVRWFDLASALCLLTIVLPMSLCFAWLARNVLEDFASGRRKRNAQPVDLSCLQDPNQTSDAVVVAQAVAERQIGEQEQSAD